MEKRQKLAESSFLKGWSEAKVYFFDDDSPLKKLKEGMPLKNTQMNQETSSCLGYKQLPASSSLL